ncbi:hypothetical protein ACWDA7_08410 [Streptomyces sp. NPDC001156]
MVRHDTEHPAHADVNRRRACAPNVDSTVSNGLASPEYTERGRSGLDRTATGPALGPVGTGAAIGP